ncbi:MAG: hypothetical protein K6G46_09630 [Prevotella sp.]|nr:hypothetical protein [Prevotella sp.]
MSGVLSTLPSAQYARFYLTQGGEAKDISATVISVTGGQTTSKDSRGVYLYTGSALTSSDLSAVTVNLPAGTYTNYQLVAVFSDDAPRDVTGTTVAQEPADLDVKYVYSFNYPTTVIDKYIKWDQNSSDKFDITSLPTDLSMSLSDINSSYYIRWRINNGTSDVNFATTIYESGKWVISSPTGGGTVAGGYAPTWNNDTPIAYLYTGKADLTSALETIGKMTVRAKGSDLFSAYPAYTVICDVFTPQPTINGSGVVTDASVPTVSYVFHFNATGKKPDTFSGALKGTGQALTGGAVVGTADKLNASDVSATLDLTNALAEVSGAKYARIYLVKDGAAVDPTGKLSVTGGTAGPELEHGFYISKPTGLTASDLSGITLSLTAGEFEDYQVMCVFSADDATSLLPAKEPDWDLQYTYTFEYPFKGDATSATKEEKTFKLPASQWTTSPKEFSIDFDFTNSKILLKNQDNSATLASVDFDKTWWDTNYSGASVSGKNFYVRWFLKNKSTGVETYIAKAIRNVNGASTYKDCAKAQYGRFWSTKIGDGQTDLNNIMRIKIDGTPDSPGTEFNITDYDLVCTIGTDGSETLDGSNQVTMEPTTLQMQYTLHFADAPFEAENLSTVKTIYKAALYDKATGNITPSLFANYQEILTELSSTLDNVRANGYVRWYVTDAAGNLVSDMADWGFTATQSYTKNNTYGHYILPNLYDYNKTQFDPTITLPSSYDKDTDYKNYKVVCVVTTDRTGMSLPDNEPTTMQVKYVFNLILTETEFSALPFVHYKGQSGRDWVVPNGSTGSQAQQYWDSSTGTAVDVTADMRQGVHTWEYDVYILPDEERTLILPFENYTSGGNNLEPRGYIRWYDWKTDTKVVDKTTDSSKKYTFAKVGTALNAADRGLFGLCLSGNPMHSTVGVTFTPDADFSESIDIACDVSKYSDGITTISGTSYLIHEPTLSNRYIFHIHPASECAAKLQASKNTLETAETTIKAGTDNAAMHDLFVGKENTMFKLAEDKGKVVVSLGASKTGSFALRFDEHNLKNYILPDGGTGYVSADKVRWYAYFENAEGIWKKQIGNEVSDRITLFSFADFTSATYSNLKGEGSLSISDGKKFHVVGYVGNGSFNPLAGTGNYAPVVHYELHFIEAAPIPVTDLALAANLERSDAYMKYHYDLAGTVDFDGNPETNENVTGHEAEYYSTTNWSDAPTSAVDNMTYVPFPWSDNQYGFSYPPLTPTIKNGYGELWVSPEHGDYIILKSMNAPGISTHDNGSAYNYYWWKSDVLYDYTHTVTDNGKYGSFLYTDASNESRTIATIPFTADLCHGSSIYFTAAVANMTGNTIKPQLLIRIVGLKGGKRIGVVAFHTCDIISAGGADGQWNQIYGVSTIPVDFDDEITSFVAEVINYANDTNGADFAIDELKVFTNTSKVMLAQTGSSCADPTAGKLKVYMDAEGLQNVFGKSDTEQTIYWRICREEDGSVVTGLGMYPQYDGGGTLIPDNDPGNLHTYGMSKVKSNFNPAAYPTGDVKDEAAREADAYGWYKAADNTIYFQLANQNFPALEEGGHYYVSVYDPNQTFDASKESFWGGLHFGATSKCSVFSNFFIPRRQYVTYTDGAGGAEGGDLMVACGGASSVSDVQMILKVPDVAEPTGFKSFDDLHYDFVFVHLDTWNSATATFNHGGTDYKYVDLKTALAHYRGASSTYKDKVGLDAGYQSENSGNYNLLSYAIAEGLLALDYSTKFTHTFSGSDYTVTCQPAEQSVTISTGATTVCSPFEVTFSLKGSSPELELGYSDVVYPPAYTKRVLRLGLEQLKNLRENGYKLHVPIRLYKDRDKKTDNTLSFTSEYLTLSAVPSDPTITTTGAKFAKIVSPTDPSAAPVVDADHMYLTLDFSGTNCGINFHEGFEYEVSTSYFDTRDVSVVGRCEGDIYLVVKIVPEFVTWNPYAIDATYYNVNWNNDTNWQRSSRTELYKGDKGSTTNTATAGHPDGYENNGEGGLSSINSTPQTYVPMKFSYVTLPANCKAPSLINMDITAYPGSDYTGGILLAGDLGTDRSPKGGTSDATSYIKYDMLVRYSYDSSDKQDECQGHYKSDGVTIIGKGDTKIYDCEKFYGNICREIYFKPGAEMINQQRLTYQKAWVEKEMDRNKWYLLSAPLKGTYAGDMYVPKANGQQDTEAFQPISFNSTTYSRTAYPIYQRSWDHSQDGGKVYTETSDPRATQYSANLKFNGAVTSTFAQWTHTYNDMAVNYTALQGFALRAHKKDGTVGEKAVIRLPKADESYTYYNYNDAAGTVTSTTTKGAGVYGRFVTDDYDNKATMTTMPLDEANINTDNEYCLVGNPYMSSIDMAAFFAKNSHLTGQYWMVDGDPATGLTTGQVKPMTSFFVKTTDRSKGVNFDNSMMIDGNANPVPTPSREFTLTATSNRGQSTASVSMGEEEKSVETLFDSNIADVPVVYTVANGQAVSINQVTDLKPVAFGVNCNSNDFVDVTFSDIEQLTDGDVFVVDAVDGKKQQIYEGDTFSIQPNDYGRYFLTFAGGTTGVEEVADVQKGIVISVRGKEVIVTSTEGISQVRALSLNGATMYQDGACGTFTSFTLAGGVYIIKAENSVGKQQIAKIIVK